MDLARAIRKTETLGQDGNSTMQIAYGVDHNFIRPMGISMTSILEYNPQAQFHIFLDDISSEDKARIQRTVERYHSSCTIYYVDSSILKHSLFVPIGLSQYIFDSLRQKYYMEKAIDCYTLMQTSYVSVPWMNCFLWI